MPGHLVVFHYIAIRPCTPLLGADEISILCCAYFLCCNVSAKPQRAFCFSEGQVDRGDLLAPGAFAFDDPRCRRSFVEDSIIAMLTSHCHIHRLLLHIFLLTQTGDFSPTIPVAPCETPVQPEMPVGAPPDGRSPRICWGYIFC